MPLFEIEKVFFQYPSASDFELQQAVLSVEKADLVGLLGPAYARTEEEGRALVREILRAPADILPDEGARLLRIRLHGLANPRSNEAVKHLCEQLNELEISYPATALRMRYEPGFVPSISATGQES